MATLTSPLNFLISNVLAGNNITIDLTNHAGKLSAIRIHSTASGSGGNLTTNENQFGPSVQLTLKDGLKLTNTFLSQITINEFDQVPLTDNTPSLGNPGLSYANVWSYNVILRDASGAPEGVQLLAPTLSGTTYIIRFPDAQGADGQILTNNGAGDLGWWLPTFSGDAGGTNSRQFGTQVLTNLSNTGAVTNVVSLSTSNATSKPITNHFENGILTLFGLEAGVGASLSANGSNIVITAGGSLTTNGNQFLGAPLSIKSGALETNVTFWQSNALLPALIATNQPGGTIDLVTFLTTNGAGIKVTSNGAVVVRGVIGSTTNYFEVRNSNNITPILAATHSNTVRIVGPLQPGYGATITIGSEDGSTQNNIELYAGSVFSGRWRSDNAGNQNISAGGSGVIAFGPDDGSGEVRFQVPAVGIVWDMIPSSAVAAWHGGTVRRGQITNVWDIFVRSNITWIEVGGSDVISLQSTSGMSSYTMFLPITNGLPGQVLYNVGSGALSWKDDATTPQPGLTTNVNQFLGVPLSIIKGAWLTNFNGQESGTNNGDFRINGDTTANGVLNANSTINAGGHIIPTFDDVFQLGQLGNAFRLLYVKGEGIYFVETAGAGSDTIELLAPSSIAAGYTLRLPDAQGANGTVVTNNGSGDLGWWNPYFGSTNVYRFNANQFNNNNVTNVNIKESALLTNTIFYSSDTNRTNVTLVQSIGQAVPVLSYRASNDSPIVELDNRGFIVIKNSLTNRVAAPTNTIAIGVDDFGGLSVPTWTDSHGYKFNIEPALFSSRRYWLQTGSGSSVNAHGITSANTGGTTISHPAPDELQPYFVNVASAATSNSSAGVSMSVNVANSGAHNGSSRMGGYFYFIEWCSTNNIAGIVGGGAPRFFTGLANAASPDLTNIVQDTNATGQYIGLMGDIKQSLNMFLTSRDGSAEFRTNTGMNFVATNIYNFSMFTSHTSRFVGWRLQDLTARTEAAGWFSNNVPTNFMKATILSKNGTNRANDIRFSRMYLQAPLSPN